MGSQLCKYFKNFPPPPGTPAEYRVKSFRQFSCAYLTNWIDLTKSNSVSGHSRELWRSPNFISLKPSWTTIALKLVKLSRMPILHGILKLPNETKNREVASLWNKVIKLTGYWKFKEETVPDATCSPSAAWSCLPRPLHCLRLHLWVQPVLLWRLCLRLLPQFFCLKPHLRGCLAFHYNLPCLRFRFHFPLNPLVFSSSKLALSHLKLNPLGILTDPNFHKPPGLKLS